MLTVLRRVLPAGVLSAAESFAVVLTVGMVVVERFLRGRDEDAARIEAGGRSEEAGVAGGFCDTVGWCWSRVLETGSEGRGPVGGLNEGREGRGREAIAGR